MIGVFSIPRSWKHWREKKKTVLPLSPSFIDYTEIERIIYTSSAIRETWSRIKKQTHRFATVGDRQSTVKFSN